MTQIEAKTSSRSAKLASGAARPILSRHADSTYWMARYMERAENIARMLLVSTETLVDLRDLAPVLLEKHWRSIPQILRTEMPSACDEPLPMRVARHMTFAAENLTSIVCCITRARENARGIREGISADMWEHLNTLYWSICSDDAPARFAEAPDQLYRQVIAGAMLFHGLADQTLARDQRWHFSQLGQYFERVAFTCRTLQEKSDLLSLADASGESPLRNVHWTAILRSCNALGTYRRQHPGELDPQAISVFLLLEPNYPRSVRHCVHLIQNSITAIRMEVQSSSVDAAERIIGRLRAHLDYTDAGEIFATGMTSELEQIVHQTSLAALAIQKSYFLH
ncbi:MAG TPA: alpha-E domain-containing protein [Tepidisphaeraceae bacterium]|nr:alpha-E domain-containing protein [Tepidisphaeraceae bacterium]